VKKIQYLLMFVLAIVLLATTLISPAALADSGKNTPTVAQQQLLSQLQSAKDPNAFYTSLTPAKQAALNQMLVVTSVTATQVPTLGNSLSAVATMGGISTFTIIVQGKNVFGVVCWSYSQSVRRGWNGTIITVADYPVILGKCSWPGWRYEGIYTVSTGGGIGRTQYSCYSQGHFTYGIGGWDIQHCYPWISMTFYGNGQASWSYHS
jgi:hypothetical protein